MEAKTEVELLKKATEQLGEHFDAVQIFVSRQDGDGTIQLRNGSGNLYARYGQVKDYIVYEEERTRLNARSDEQDY